MLEMLPISFFMALKARPANQPPPKQKLAALPHLPPTRGDVYLRLSKLLMHEFFYDTPKQRYHEDVQFLYTDTDSLILEYRTTDLYQDMSTMLDVFDTSSFPVDHQLFSTATKKVAGKFEDELGGKLLKELMGLR